MVEYLGMKHNLTPFVHLCYCLSLFSLPQIKREGEKNGRVKVHGRIFMDETQSVTFWKLML